MPGPSRHLSPQSLKQRISSEFSKLKGDLLDFSSFHASKRISIFFDGLVNEAFSYASGAEDFCLIAAGSYSKMELCPYSDIDIMILTGGGEDHESVGKRLKGFFYLFWDASVDMAQSVRTINEAVSLMSTDLNTYTSFIDARYIGGNRELFDSFKAEFKKIDARNVFALEMMKSLRQRRLVNVMTDNDIFLLEPDVKEGIGGLRDYSYCEWLYSITGGVRATSVFPGNEISIPFAPILGADDLNDLYEAKKFILKVRIMMHLISGKKVDRLSFELQERASRELFYKDGRFLNKIEYFMHDYYKSAKNMHIISRVAVSLMIKPSIVLNRPKKSLYLKTINPPVSPDHNISFEEKFLSGPRNLFTLLEAYQATGDRLDPVTINLLKKAASSYRSEIKNADYAKTYFLSLLKKKKRVYETLLLMHETGILSALIPEFEKIDSLSTNDIFHIYTVDAHSLNGINYLQQMVNLKINRELKYIFEDIDENDLMVLNYSLLLHDIGKGYSSHHESIGARIAVKAAKRIGMDENARSLVWFLILNHFLMPLTSERRDIHDPSTIKSIAGVARDAQRLKLLFIVSICDSMAVSKTRFNSWRKMLLIELFERTSSFIKNTAEYFKSDEYYARGITDYISGFIGKRGYNFLKKFKGDAEGLKSFISNYSSGFYSPRKYLVRETPENVLLHLKLFSKISPSHKFNFLASAHKEEDYYEITICGYDKKSIFSEITGVLSFFDFNIMTADINTRKDGLFIDAFFINHLYKNIDNNIDWHKLRNTFFNVFNGRASLNDMFRKKMESEKLYKKSAPRVSNSVEIYNSLSDEFTVIEIQALDRKGLLYDIGRIFNRFGINIFTSKITTEGNKAYDTFYIKGEDGKKIKSLLTINRIKKALVEGL